MPIAISLGEGVCRYAEHKKWRRHKEASRFGLPQFVRTVQKRPLW